MDVTKGNRANLSATDPGGRLGPWTDAGTDDLRNLRLYYVECCPGDILLLVTDGVHDNFDPEYVGKAAEEFGILR